MVSRPKAEGGISKAYAALLAAAEKLMAVIKKASGYPNGDLRDAARAIEDICEKLDR